MGDGLGGKLRAALAVRQEPAAFQGHAEKGWIIGEAHWSENPLIAAPPWAFTVVDLWLDCKRLSGASIFGRGAAPLPCPGSVGEQPAALMDAFALLDSWTEKN